MFDPHGRDGSRAIPRRGAPRILLASIGVLGLFALSLEMPAQARETPRPLRALHDSAYFAWDRGDYVAALEQAERLLTAPGGEALLERVALLTGELHPVQELATDGRGVRWSADGRHAAYESGSGLDVRTRIVSVGPPAAREIASVAGRGASFSPDGRRVALLRITETPELTRNAAARRAALDAGDRARVRQLDQEAAPLQERAARVIVRELATGRETERSAPPVGMISVTYAGDGSLILVGRPTQGEERTELYVLPGQGAHRALTSSPGRKGDEVMSAGTSHLVFTLERGRFAILNLRGGTTPRVIAGAGPTVSADGSTLAWLTLVDDVPRDMRRGEAHVGADARGGGLLTAVMVMRLDGGEPVEVKRTTLPVGAPALSPSGRRVAYATVLRDDWEIVLVNADGSGEQRLTRDIQHDLLPRFLSETRLLATMGEARHRRAYLYELDRDAQAESAARPIPGDDQRGRTRLFDNNTVRTVAPQYEWVPNAEGTQVLVVADRDGNTLSPERGVYLVDLTRRVTRDEVLARVRRNLAAERDLRERGRAAFAAIEPRVREAVAAIEVGRIYDHAHALYQFGSKFITQPGNRLAVDYLANALREMGYEPELQWFEPRRGVRSANVVVTVRGTAHPDRVYVVSSHFDSVEPSPGADDNSSGTTALLEVARVLATRPQPATIRLAFLTAEESGLLGARELVRRAQAEGMRISGVLNNDMIGWTRSHRLDNTIRYSNDWVRDIQHAAAMHFTELITYDSRYVLNTDAQAFWDAYGDIVGGMGSYPILGNPHYHMPNDNLEVINHRLVAEVSRTTLAAIMRMAQDPVLPASGTANAAQD